MEEETVDGFKRINKERTVQLLKPHPDYIAANCPYCMTMITDGLKGANREEVQVLDVCEFMWNNLALPVLDSVAQLYLPSPFLPAPCRRTTAKRGCCLRTIPFVLQQPLLMPYHYIKSVLPNVL